MCYCRFEKWVRTSIHEYFTVPQLTSLRDQRKSALIIFILPKQRVTSSTNRNARGRSTTLMNPKAFTPTVYFFLNLMRYSGYAW